MNSANLMLSAAIASLMLFSPTAFTTADAANIKIKPQIVKVKPKIRIAKPKVRVKIRAAKVRIKPKVKVKVRTAKIRIKPKVKIKVRAAQVRVKPKLQLTTVKLHKKPRVTPKVAVSRKTKAGLTLAALNSHSRAGRKLLNEAPKIGQFAELAQNRLLKEHIVVTEGMLNISGLDGSMGVPGVSDWGTGTGQDGNQYKPLENDNGAGKRGFDDPAGRRGPGTGRDYSNVASDHLDRVSKGLSSGEKMGGAVTSPGSPTDALGGIASQRTVTLPPASQRYGIRQQGRTRGSWQSDDAGGRFRVTRVWGSNGTTVTVDTVTASGRKYSTTAVWRNSGNDELWVTDPPGTNSAPDKGSGHAGEKVDPGKDIAKQQAPYSGGTAVWIPPSCGSAECNGIRGYLKNPKGALQQAIASKSTRVHGDREGGTGTNTTQQLMIDQHALVVSYGAESGPQRTGGGRVQRFDKSKFQSD